MGIDFNQPISHDHGIEEPGFAQYGLSADLSILQLEAHANEIGATLGRFDVAGEAGG